VGAAIGLYESTVADEYVPYIVPQEHGNHTRTRWLSLLDEQGTGLRIESPEPEGFDFSASHLTAEELTAATHTNELEPRAEVILNLDRIQRGIGTGACGPDTLPAYTTRPGLHDLHLRFRRA
jgi:beta-galactosidase